MTKYFFFLILLIAAWSCKNDPAETGSTNAPPVNIDSLPYALLCVDITQPGDQTPHHDVYAIAGKDTFKVGTIEVCERIDPANYAEYEIPEDAMYAVGGKSADNSMYAVYIGKSPEGKITARMGDMYPGKPSGSFDYRTWVVLTQEDVQPVSNSPVSPDNLVGSYVHSSPEGSIVLYVGLSHRTFVAQAYSLAGALPEDPAALMEAIAQTQAEFIPNLQVDFSDLSFTCSKGQGRFQTRNGQVQGLTFASWEGRKDLSLEKKAVGAGQ